VYGVVRERTPFREDQPCQPENSYGIQKLTAEHYLRIMAERDMLSAVTLRIGNAYGWILPPDRLQGFVGTAVHRVLHGLPIRILGDPENVRDYVHVDDVCDALLRALEMRTRYEVFNVGTGVGTSVSQILRMLEELSGRALTARVEHMPGAERLPPWCVLDCTRAATQLGWRARIPLANGLRRMLDAARAAA
jgi:UDP-glucose 4-epimerase